MPSKLHRLIFQQIESGLIKQGSFTKYPTTLNSDLYISSSCWSQCTTPGRRRYHTATRRSLSSSPLTDSHPCSLISALVLSQPSVRFNPLLRTLGYVLQHFTAILCLMTFTGPLSSQTSNSRSCHSKPIHQSVYDLKTRHTNNISMRQL